MIAKLTGVVDTIGLDSVVIDVNGVGYLVTCSGRALGRMTRGERMSLIIETFIREERIILQGFIDAGERDWFRLLTTIQGVGPKAAFALLSVLDPDQLARSIAAQDKTALIRADGVGPKLALRILNELKDKVGDLALGSAARTPVVGVAAVPADTTLADVVSALVNLGYGRTEAYGAALAARRELGEDAQTAALIRHGLKELGK